MCVMAFVRSDDANTTRAGRKVVHESLHDMCAVDDTNTGSRFAVGTSECSVATSSVSDDSVSDSEMDHGSDNDIDNDNDNESGASPAVFVSPASPIDQPLFPLQMHHSPQHIPHRTTITQQQQQNILPLSRQTSTSSLVSLSTTSQHSTKASISGDNRPLASRRSSQLHNSIMADVDLESDISSALATHMPPPPPPPTSLAVDQHNGHSSSQATNGNPPPATATTATATAHQSSQRGAPVKPARLLDTLSLNTCRLLPADPTSSIQPFVIAALPVDIVARILGFLHPKELAILASTSKWVYAYLDAIKDQIYHSMIRSHTSTALRRAFLSDFPDQPPFAKEDIDIEFKCRTKGTTSRNLDTGPRAVYNYLARSQQILDRFRALRKRWYENPRFWYHLLVSDSSEQKALHEWVISVVKLCAVTATYEAGIGAGISAEQLASVASNYFPRRIWFMLEPSRVTRNKAAASKNTILRSKIMNIYRGAGISSSPSRSPSARRNNAASYHQGRQPHGSRNHSRGSSSRLNMRGSSSNAMDTDDELFVAQSMQYTTDFNNGMDSMTTMLAGIDLNNNKRREQKDQWDGFDSPLEYDPDNLRFISDSELHMLTHHFVVSEAGFQEFIYILCSGQLLSVESILRLSANSDNHGSPLPIVGRKSADLLMDFVSYLLPTPELNNNTLNRLRSSEHLSVDSTFSNSRFVPTMDRSSVSFSGSVSTESLVSEASDISFITSASEQERNISQKVCHFLYHSLLPYEMRRLLHTRVCGTILLLNWLVETLRLYGCSCVKLSKSSPMHRTTGAKFVRYVLPKVGNDRRKTLLLHCINMFADNETFWVDRGEWRNDALGYEVTDFEKLFIRPFLRRDLKIQF